MNFELTDDQHMMRDSFARFLDEQSSTVKVRAAMPLGFDATMWRGLAELGALAMRVSEDAGGLGLGLIDATVLMEEAGRTLVSGPLAETLVTARLIGQLGGDAGLLARIVAGETVVSIALHDSADEPIQWIAGGAVAEAVVARRGQEVVLLSVSGRSEENLASTPIAEIDLSAQPSVLLGSGDAAVAAFDAAVEEWKLLMAAGLSGLARQALQLAAAYAAERKQFGQFIGTFQAVSHPMADLLAEIDGGRLLLWRAIRAIADGEANAGALISLAGWWHAETAARTVAQALHTFGGYGLTTEYDIHLFNLRSKAWPLVWGDPKLLLEQAGRRLYGGEATSLPEPGAVPVDFDLGDEARAMSDEIDAFFEKHVTDEMRKDFHYSWEGYNPQINKMLAEAKLLFLGWPEEMGGRGVSPYAKLASMDAFERNGYNNPAQNVAAMVGAIIHRFGSEDVKRDILDRMVSGEVICSLGYSEPGSGSDVFAAQCKATPDGNGWRIDGTKMFTSGANIADYVLMLTRTNPDVAKHKGLTMFMVPLKAEGVTIQPVHTFQDERTNITFYDGVKIPDSYRLGPVDEGVRTMSAGLELEHGGSFAKVQFAMLEAAEELAREIRVKGRPLIEQPQAQARLARTLANTLASQLLGYRSAWASVEKKPRDGFGPMAKMFSSEKFLSDSRDLLDLTAPLSLSKREGPAGFVNQCYRHAHGTTIYAGTSEVHRSMIAERALGQPRTRA